MAGWGGGGIPIQALRTMGQGHQPAADSLPTPLKRILVSIPKAGTEAAALSVPRWPGEGPLAQETS